MLGPLLGLGGGVLLAQLLLRLREHTPNYAGFADLLPWAAAIDNGLFLTKDGSFVAGWLYRGPDPTTSTAEELLALSDQVSAVLADLDGWVLHSDLIRQPAPPYRASTTFPDPASALIDRERAALFASGKFETLLALTLTFQPPAETSRRIRTFLVSDPHAHEVPWGRVLDAFKGRFAEIDSRLSALLKLEPLDTAGLLRHLNRCLRGVDHPVLPPDPPVDIDYLLAGDFVGGWTPALDGRHVRTLAVHGYPLQSRPAMTRFLSALPFSFRYSNRVHPLPPSEAQALLAHLQQRWWAARTPVRQLLADALANREKRGSAEHQRERQQNEDLAAVDAAAEAQAALGLASSGTRFAFHTGTLVVHADSARDADETALALVRAFAEYGFLVRVETVNSVEAFLGTLPGNGVANVRRAPAPLTALTDLVPLTTTWAGALHCPNPNFPPLSPPLLCAVGQDNTPFRLNLYHGDVGHTLVLGTTGAGKSTVVQLIAAQHLRYPGAQVFYFDVGRSAEILTHALEGHHHQVGLAGGLSLQPLAEIDDPHELAWGVDWIETLVALQGLDLSPAQRTRVAASLQLLATQDKRHRTLTDFAIGVQDADLQAALRPFCAGGEHAFLLDTITAPLAPVPFTTFEIKPLLDASEKVSVPTLLALFHLIERQLDGRPTLLVIEEAWLPLLHPRFASRVKEWLLTLRKRSAAVLLVTQSPAHLLEAADRHSILGSCPTRLYTANPNAHRERALYRELGLTEGQIEGIARALPRRDYYFSNPDGGGFFELALGPLQLALLTPGAGRNLPEGLALVEQLRHAYGRTWLAEWLRLNNVPLSEEVTRWAA